MEARPNGQSRVFTLELNSGKGLKKVNVPDGTQRLLMEGTIGTLKRAKFVEGAILELIGTEGTLRVDLSMEDLASSDRRGGVAP